FRPPFLSLDWTGLDEDEDAHVWEDNWDDDNVEDDFSNQLRMLHEEQTVCNTACLNSSWVDLPCAPGKAIILVSSA
uniref:26S proteasome complex subunit SEM1 n=1 Tax=Ficedula albicollis TaxID=59894 RepID=U3K6P9_FICAL